MRDNSHFPGHCRECRRSVEDAAVSLAMECPEIPAEPRDMAESFVRGFLTGVYVFDPYLAWEEKGVITYGDAASAAEGSPYAAPAPEHLFRAWSMGYSTRMRFATGAVLCERAEASHFAPRRQVRTSKT